MVLKFPDWWDDHEYEYEAKGCFGEMEITNGEQSVMATFYDSYRLHQEVDNGLEKNPMFLENNIIVVPRVNKAAIIASVAVLGSDFETLL